MLCERSGQIIIVLAIVVFQQFSKVTVDMAPAANDFHGIGIDLRRFGGATALRVIHPAGQLIAEHRHDWPCLTLHVLGSYTEHLEGGDIGIDGPSAVLHPPGAFHANRIGPRGLETVSIQFDPTWLRSCEAKRLTCKATTWRSGTAAANARRLSEVWSKSTNNENQLRNWLRDFLLSSNENISSSAPKWMQTVDNTLNSDTTPSTLEMARSLHLHPAWLNRAYRRLRGEGIQETLRRKRVERAAHLLRTTFEPLSHIAVVVGFCDQSHMTRAMRAVIGRTPLQVRYEAANMALIT